MTKAKDMPDISPSEYHGMLSFETSERYATVTVSFKTRTPTVRGGDIRGAKHPVPLTSRHHRRRGMSCGRWVSITTRTTGLTSMILSTPSVSGD